MSRLRTLHHEYATTEVVWLALGCLSLAERLRVHLETHGQPSLPQEPADDTLYAVLGAVALVRRIRRLAAAAGPAAARPAPDDQPPLRTRQVLR